MYTAFLTGHENGPTVPAFRGGVSRELVGRTELSLKKSVTKMAYLIHSPTAS